MSNYPYGNDAEAHERLTETLDTLDNAIAHWGEAIGEVRDALSELADARPPQWSRQVHKLRDLEPETDVWGNAPNGTEMQDLIAELRHCLSEEQERIDNE